MINISVTLGAIIEEDMLLEMENQRYTDDHKRRNESSKQKQRKTMAEIGSSTRFLISVKLD